MRLLERSTQESQEPQFYERGLVAGLYLAEGLAIAIPFLVYRAQGKATLMEFLLSRPGLMCAGALIALVGTVAYVIQQCRAGIRSGANQWAFGLAMNLMVVVILVIIGEIGLRVWSVKSNTEERVAGRLLYPRQWDVVRGKFQAILSRAKDQQTFWVEDPDLGWTIGPNRKSADGLYFSSAEGIRSGEPDVTYRGTTSACRIALVGDSYAFGEEVRFEESMGYSLDSELRHRCQILNFGVGGYGVDQMYLRYLRDVRPWKPDIVVMAFINHDVVRTFSIYSFLLFPGGETPFAKPRFVFQGGVLSQLNQPLITADDLFSKPSIRELPYISYDINYKETEWDRRSWQFFNQSYLFRFLTSIYPLYEQERPEISEQELQVVNSEIFKNFQEKVKADGAKPLIVYLPTLEEVPDRLPWEFIGPKTLRESGVGHINLRDCMAAGYSTRMFMQPGRGSHYSPEGNRVAAGCLKEPIESLMPSKPLRGAADIGLG